MSTIESIIEKLEKVQADVNEIMDAVGRLNNDTPGMQQGGLGLGGTGLPANQDQVIPPTAGSTEEVVGGEETAAFPDCCAVGNNTDFYCSGTLIAPNLVVTADHCTDITRVFLKGNNIDKPAEGEIIRVIRKYTHPTLDLRLLVLEHDSTVTPRHIAQGPEVGSPKVALAVGFGAINPWGTFGYGIKRKVELPITSLSCSQEDAEEYGCKVGFEIVGGHRGIVKNSCKGDSGGPFYIKHGENDYYLLGATSRGIKNSSVICGDGAVYVRVDLCLNWIREVSGIEIEGPLI